MSKAHVFDSRERTRDVQINEDVTFEGLILSESTLKGLKASGFERPSPIQLVAIPLGKCGFDLIAEAKSGTGKTVMFGVTALEMLQLPSKSLQVLILTPTREIAAQVGDVLSNIGSGHKGLKVAVFIGGLPVEEDRRRAKHCHIAVGTPGRLKHLIDDELLDVSHIRLIVIDEADKLLEPSFEPDIVHIFKTLPLNKQVIAASATYTPELKVFLEDFMRSPIRVNPEEKCLDAGSGVLLGVRQVAALVPHEVNYLNKMKKKIDALVVILSSVPFKQCIVFNNFHGVVENISGTLNSKGWPTEFLSSGIDQPARLRVIKKFYDFKCRVLLSTDLVARGIDVANVNLVINFDVPMTSATYLHRVGRSGRFGTEGLAVTLVEDNSKDLTRLKGMVQDLQIPMQFSPVQNLIAVLSEKPAETTQDSASNNAKEESDTDLSDDETKDNNGKEDSSSDSYIGVDSLPPDNDNKLQEPIVVDELEVALRKELTEMYISGKSDVARTPPPSPQKQSPFRRLPFSSPRSDGSPRREYSGRGYHNRNNYSPQQQRSPGFSTSSLSSSPYSSNCSTPRKDFGTEKLVSNFAKYSDEQHRPQGKEPTSFTARMLSSPQQQYYQQQFEFALHNLSKDVRSYLPPKEMPVQGYDVLEQACKQFDTKAVFNAAFERSEPYLSRTVYRSLTLGMGKRLGVQVNLAKRHLAFNGGIKAYLNKLVEDCEPQEEDLPTWEPSQDGFRVSRDCWLYGNDHVRSSEAEAPASEEPAPRRRFQRPRQQVFAESRDGVHLVVPPAPQEHHTFTFPHFPTEPGASLATWKEQVKLTTFMIHYSEYFRMMNKIN
ncbi:probable ATP-dependent RNA helicase DDX20 [Cloeon dipterum]|uniref:probable ATP-dependent RNA helicase DDX20 n=1 Tax=Cloeon dipterum TaxID=197152 RepID=UPI00321FBE2E